MDKRKKKKEEKLGGMSPDIKHSQQVLNLPGCGWTRRSKGRCHQGYNGSIRCA